jgi:carbon-monoxide dehydrogenase large subunit
MSTQVGAPPEAAVPGAASSAPWRIGTAPPRREDARLITGRGRYVADIDLPGQLHCAFVRSPHAHARVLSIDSGAALGLPGVRAVLRGAEMAADGVGTMRCLWPVQGVNGPAIEPPRWGLARDRVRHVGEPVALVVAGTRAQAEDAAEQVAVEYEALPALTTAAAALAKGAVALHDEAPGNLCYRYERGQRDAAEAAFAGAAHVTRLSLTNQRLAGCALEPRGVLAAPQGAGLLVYSATQVPHHLRRLIAEQLGIAEDLLRVVAPDVGGGFGYKGKYYPEEIVLAWAARRLQLPLRWIASRGESFISDLQGRDHVTQAALALDADGRFLGVRVHTRVNLGAYVSTMGSAVSSVVYSGLLSGMYRIPALHAVIEGVFTSTVPTDAYRGAGRPEACYVLERLIDAAARELGIGRAELRRRNLIPLAAMPYASSAGPVYDCGDFPRVFERALALADHAGFKARQRAALAQGRYLGLGMACFVESSGVGPSKMALAVGSRVSLEEHAELALAPDGSLTAVVGTQNHGQGHETVFSQILGARLGVAPGAIRVVEGDTGRIAQGTGTFGSRSAAVGGSALLRAADALVARGKALLAGAWGVPQEDVGFSAAPQGRFHAGSRHADFAQLALLSPRLAARGRFDPEAFAFSNGVHLCEVEVDTDSGRVTLLRYSAVDDVGNIIHPTIVEGQLHGGVVQGLGQGLREACVHDPETGQPLAGSFMDYGLLRAHDLPARFDSENDESQPYGLNPLGAKGAGEAGAIAAPAALVSAVLDALRPLGVMDLEMPLTPPRVWAAIQAARARSGSDR